MHFNAPPFFLLSMGIPLISIMFLDFRVFCFPDIYEIIIFKKIIQVLGEENVVFMVHWDFGKHPIYILMGLQIFLIDHGDSFDIHCVFKF